MVQIDRATEVDVPSICALLSASNLPTDGFAAHWPTALVARQQDQVVGSAALEVYDRAALLRSVAVAEVVRGQGLGQQLTKAALNLAQECGIRQVYVLTETAQTFFPRFGFQPIERAAVDVAVQQSVEFQSACPASAVAMVTHLSSKCDYRTRPATPADATTIADIYNQGIEDRVATFETALRTPEDIRAWFDGVHPIVVVEDAHGIIAFASTSSYRSRQCYAGIAEFSVYVAREARGSGAGRVAMDALIAQAERAGLWKLLSRVFVENVASRKLLGSLGFREVGIYEKHAQLDGVWRDVVIVERLIPANIS